MGRHLITAPTDDVVTLEEAKAHLRVTNTDNDDLIEALIASAVAQIDPAGGGWLGRALRPQTWELRLNGFPYCDEPGIELPYPPLISLDSLVYDDGDGVETAMTVTTEYRVIAGGLGKSIVLPAYNTTWPSSVRSDYETVRVRFTSGYAVTTPDSLPQPIKQAVLLAVRDLWSLGERNLYLRSESVPGLASYEWTVSDNAGKVIRDAVGGLLGVYRVYE